MSQYIDDEAIESEPERPEKLTQFAMVSPNKLDDNQDDDDNLVATGTWSLNNKRKSEGIESKDEPSLTQRSEASSDEEDFYSLMNKPSKLYRPNYETKKKGKKEKPLVPEDVDSYRRSLEYSEYALLYERLQGNFLLITCVSNIDPGFWHHTLCATTKDDENYEVINRYKGQKIHLLDYNNKKKVKHNKKGYDVFGIICTPPPEMMSNTEKVAEYVTEICAWCNDYKWSPREAERDQKGKIKPNHAATTTYHLLDDSDITRVDHSGKLTLRKPSEVVHPTELCHYVKNWNHGIFNRSFYKKHGKLATQLFSPPYPDAACDELGYPKNK